MALDKKKTQNIITIAVAAVAVILVVLVLLVKTGVIGPRDDRDATETTEIETYVTIIYETSVDDEGNIFEYSITDFYTRPSHSSNHRYPTTTKLTTTKEQALDYYYEYSNAVAVTDESGNAVTNENGEAVTKVEKHTIKADKDGNTEPVETTTVTTSQQTTKTVYKTDPVLKKPIKDIHGNYVVDRVETEAPTTTTTTTAPSLEFNSKPVTTTKKPSSTATTTKKASETKAPSSAPASSGATSQAASSATSSSPDTTSSGNAITVVESTTAVSTTAMETGSSVNNPQ